MGVLSTKTASGASSFSSPARTTAADSPSHRSRTRRRKNVFKESCCSLDQIVTGRIRGRRHRLHVSSVHADQDQTRDTSVGNHPMFTSKGFDEAEIERNHLEGRPRTTFIGIFNSSSTHAVRAPLLWRHVGELVEFPFSRDWPTWCTQARRQTHLALSICAARAQQFQRRSSLRRPKLLPLPFNTTPPLQPGSILGENLPQSPPVPRDLSQAVLELADCS